MIIECTNPRHTADERTGAVSCPDPDCIVAAAGRRSPMDRLPSERPEWLLECPHPLDHEEVEALALLGDYGLIPQIVEPELGDAPIDYVPWTSGARRHRAG